MIPLQTEFCSSDEAACLLMVSNFLPHSFTSPPVGEGLALRLQQEGWRVILTSHKIGKVARLLDMSATTLRYRREYSVAAVDVFSGAAFRWAEVVCSLLGRIGKPSILTLHGGNLPTFAEGRETRIRALLQSAAAVTTPSNYLKEKLQRFRDEMILLPNPIDLAVLPYRHRTALQPHLVWLRAFHSIYNPTMAIEVLHRVRQIFPDATLTMIGPDKKDGSWEATRRRVAERGLDRCVTMPGGVPKAEVGAWLNKGDIFLNTTTVDNTPVSVLEAMACGLCIVSTDAGGLPYLITQNREGLLTPSGDSEKMTAAVLHLLTEAKEAANLSANAHHYAAQCDWERVLPRWTELLKRVALERRNLR